MIMIIEDKKIVDVQYNIRLGQTNGSCVHFIVYDNTYSTRIYFNYYYIVMASVPPVVKL